MPQIIPVIAGAAAYLLGPAGGVILFGGAIKISFAAILGTVVTLGASLAVGMLMKPKAGRTTTSGDAQDRKQVIRGSVEPRQMIYGYQRVGGALVYAASSGADLRYLHLVVVLACHRCDGIPVVWINGQSIFASDCDGSGMVTRSDHPFAGKVRIEKYLGDQTSGSAALIAESPDGWSGAHALRECTYLYVRLEFDSDRMSGLQSIEAEVRGKNDVGDPRTSTGSFTSNWALCVLDYLRHPLGLGCSAEEIDWDSFIAAANLSDEAVQIAADGTTQTRYVCDIAFKLDRAPIDIMDSLLSAGGGALVYVQGRYRLYGAAYSAPTASIGQADCAGDIEIMPRPARKELFSAVRGTYIEPSQNFQATEFGAVFNPPFDEQDGGERIWKDVEYPAVNNRIRAERLSRILLLRARDGLKIKVPLKYHAVRFAVWQVVAFSHPDLGMANKPFRIVGWSYDPTSGQVAVEMQEENAFNYGWLWDYASTVPAVPDTTLIDPLTLPVPAAPSLTATTVLNADGAAVPAIEVAWSSPAHAFVTAMEVQWREAAGVWVSMTVDAAVGRATITPVISGTTYEVRTRHLAALARSGWSISSMLAALADTIAPGAPLFPGAVSRALGIAVSWVAPSDTDIAYFEVEERPDTTGSSWIQVNTTAATRYTRLGLSPGEAKRYRVRAIDRSGNLGAWSAEVAATAGAVVDGDLAAGAVTTPTVAADAITTFASTSGFTTITGDGAWHLALSMAFAVPDSRAGTLLVSLQHGYGSEVSHLVEVHVDGALYADRGSAAINDYVAFSEPLIFAAGTHSIDIWWKGDTGMVLNRRNMTLMLRAR
ncbi:phage tail protein [Rhodovarius lipocyclicus]|uniref:phage tail protein n=1 Tax=Rhodovarius lipocyclicus TaxID=268410 RepID=UPI001357FAE7|nr:phage tail protein [Rhodovarius lipocyclicus]